MCSAARGPRTERMAKRMANAPASTHPPRVAVARFPSAVRRCKVKHSVMEELAPIQNALVRRVREAAAGPMR